LPATHKIAVLLRRDPDVTVAPAAEISELLHFLVVVLDIIFDGKASGVIDADIATEAEENPGGFECEEARVRSVDTITHVRLTSDFSSARQRSERTLPITQAPIQHQHLQPLACLQDILFRHLDHSTQFQPANPIPCCDFWIEDKRTILLTHDWLIVFFADGK
jgi:hypothetical protein